MGMIGQMRAVTELTLLQLQRGKLNIEDLLFSEEEDEGVLDLDKAWHGIHYLLNQSAWEGEEPLFNAVLGGSPIGDDLGYGQARSLTPAQVKQVAAALPVINEGNLANYYHPEEMNELPLYPDIDWQAAEEGDYLLSYYKEMYAYYQQAAEKGEGMLLYIV